MQLRKWCTDHLLSRSSVLSLCRMREDADTTDDSILRADTRSRVRTPAAKREQTLAEFERSGLSGARFARLHGINCPTLMAWTCKERVSTSPGVSAAGSAVDPLGVFPLNVGLVKAGPMSLDGKRLPTEYTESTERIAKR